MAEEKNKSILIVDDNDDVRRLLTKVLERSGYRVEAAVDGESALQVLESFVPDLILMDIRLPGELDGLETTRRIKDDARLQRVPVVALTASVLERDRHLALAAGCSGFIAKPVDITALPGTVEKYIERGVTAPR